MGHRSRFATSAGFTLVELMIAVVVVAILAALAYPSLLDSIRKGRRSDGFQALTAVMQAQERHRASKANYASSITAAPTDDPAGLGLSDTSQAAYYSLTLSDVSATTFTATATAASGKSQSQDGSCVRLRIRIAGGNVFYGSAGEAGPFDEGASNPCWKR